MDNHNCENLRLKDPNAIPTRGVLEQTLGDSYAAL